MLTVMQWFQFGLAVFLFAAPAPLLAQQSSGGGAQTPPVRDGDNRINIRTELVSLTVTVTDMDGRYFADLDRDAFAVYEDGVRQEISFFSDRDAPAGIGIVLDVSNSMAGAKIERAREALARFIQTSHEEDDYFLIGFNDSPQLLLDGVRGSEALLSRISELKPHGSTALYDAVTFSLDQVARSRHHKRALIVISDGEDNMSRSTFSQVRRKFQEADVTIYTVLIGPVVPRSNGGFIMDILASASGGKSYSPSNVEKMSEAFEQIALELRHQYSIGYTPSNLNPDGRWRRLKVAVTPPAGAPRLVVRSRKEYYATRRNLGDGGGRME
jgi:Ca-activated chloride channel family protein